MITAKQAKSVLAVFLVAAITNGLSSCSHVHNEMVSYRSLSIYESCDEHTEPFMQVQMDDITEGRSSECVKKHPLAHDAPVDSIKLTYNKKIKMYSLRFFPARDKAGSLFYVINSRLGKSNQDLDLVMGRKVVAHPRVTSAQTKGFFDLRGFSGEDMSKLINVLVVGDQSGKAKIAELMQ